MGGGVADVKDPTGPVTPSGVGCLVGVGWRPAVLGEDVRGAPSPCPAGSAGEEAVVVGAGGVACAWRKSGVTGEVEWEAAPCVDRRRDGEVEEAEDELKLKSSSPNEIPLTLWPSRFASFSLCGEPLPDERAPPEACEGDSEGKDDADEDNARPSPLGVPSKARRRKEADAGGEEGRGVEAEEDTATAWAMRSRSVDAEVSTGNGAAMARNSSCWGEDGPVAMGRSRAEGGDACDALAPEATVAVGDDVWASALVLHFVVDALEESTSRKVSPGGTVSHSGSHPFAAKGVAWGDRDAVG